VEFAKTHEWGMDMIYYLGLTYYLEGKYGEALQQLNKIEQKDFFSPKISYLYGMIFEKAGKSTTRSRRIYSRSKRAKSTSRRTSVWRVCILRRTTFRSQANTRTS